MPSSSHALFQAQVPFLKAETTPVICPFSDPRKCPTNVPARISIISIPSTLILQLSSCTHGLHTLLTMPAITQLASIFIILSYASFIMGRPGMMATIFRKCFDITLPCKGPNRTIPSITAYGSCCPSLSVTNAESKSENFPVLFN